MLCAVAVNALTKHHEKNSYWGFARKPIPRRNQHATAVALPTIVPLFSRTVEICALPLDMWAEMTFVD